MEVSFIAVKVNVNGVPLGKLLFVFVALVHDLAGGRSIFGRKFILKIGGEAQGGGEGGSRSCLVLTQKVMSRVPA